MANVFRTGVLRTLARDAPPRPNPTLFSLPGLTARPLWAQEAPSWGKEFDMAAWCKRMEDSLGVIREE